ncbi:hypothetical protein ACIBVL_07370 [Streptomyces sp. NPDC049687]|uniref:hypothetical protein n=1 Tax=Streptomyces sp. NPDC049687 TaxID=3365596 RepID=UPI0037ACED8C
MSDDREPPETALEEVLREIEDAETRADDPEDERRRRRGEAAEAITPNQRAQEESEGD